MNADDMRKRILLERAKGLSQLPQMSRQWAQAVQSQMSSGEDLWLCLWEWCAKDNPDVFYAMCRLTVEVFQAHPEMFPSVPEHIKGFGLREENLTGDEPDSFLASEVLDALEQQEHEAHTAEVNARRQAEQEARERYLASLTPAQRQRLEEEEARTLHASINGLLDRDVQ